MAEISLTDFLLKLTHNLNILKEREAKYASAAPLDLLNQIDDYEQALGLTQQAIDQNISFDQLQTEFGGLNLQISTVVFVAQVSPRKPFTGQNPYRGLRKFTEAEAQFFFGRTAAIQNLLDLVQRLFETEITLPAPDLVAVLGASGSGKSSLVRAGLIPALRAGRLPGSQHWPVKVMLPGPHPLEALAALFLNNIGRSLAALRAELDEGEKGLHYLITEYLADQPEEVILVLVVDQFEELFTLCEHETERQAFLDQLLYACQVRRNRCLVILTMRADFYAKVGAFKRLAEVITLNQMLVSRMTEKELREAILLPAEAVGLELEKALVETLLKDTFEAPGVLPLLQHALLELFDRREGNLLTLEAYHEIGGVQGSIAHQADSVMQELTSDQQQIVRRVFLRLIQLGEGTVDTRRRTTFNEVLTHVSQAAEYEAIVQTLTNANLLVTSRDSQTNQMVLDVSHEALIREWPTLRKWLDENREALRIHRRLAEAAMEWMANHLDTSYLYQGVRLAEAEEWTQTHGDDLNELERAFLAASVDERERLTNEREAQRQRELAAARKLAEAEEQRAKEAEARASEQAQAATRLRRRALWLAGVGFMAVFLAIAAGVFGVRASVSESQAVNAGETAQAEATKALNAGETAQAEATKALNAEGTAQAERAAAQTAEVQAVTERDNAERQSRISLAKSVAALAPRLLDATQDYEVSTLLAVEAFNINRTQKGDGLALIDNSLRDILSHPHFNTIFDEFDYDVYALDFSPDSQTLAFATSDHLYLWNLSRPYAQPSVLDDISAVSILVTLSPDARKLATYHTLDGKSGDIQLWDLSTSPVIPYPIGRNQPKPINLSFSVDGNRLTTISLGGAVHQWDLTQPSVESVTLPNIAGWPSSLSEQTFIYDADLSADGKVIAIPDIEKNTVNLWNLSEPGSPPRKLKGYISDILGDAYYQVLSVAFSPDGKILAFGSGDRTVQLFDLSAADLGPPAVLRGHRDGVVSLRFSPDGKTLASGAMDSSIRLWDVAQPAAAASHILTEAEARAFNFDEQTVPIDRDNNLVLLSSLSTVQSLNDIPSGYKHQVSAAALSPNGYTLATAGIHQNFLAYERSEAIIHLLDLRSLDQPPLSLPPHDGYVTFLAFSPDGNTLASSSSDNVYKGEANHITLRLWDLSNLEAEPIVLGKLDDINFAPLAFSEDGSILASKTTNLEVTIHSWLMPDSLVKVACHKVRRNLSQTEWTQYFPGEAYRQTCKNLPPHPSVRG